jgi:hypothetical protein
MGWIIGGFIGVGLVALFYLRSGAMGCKYVYVPDGEDWRAFYRKSRDTKKRGGASGRMTWVVIGIGLGVAAVAVVLSMVG